MIHQPFEASGEVPCSVATLRAYLSSVEARNRDGNPTRLYQLKLTEIMWKPGDGKTVRADAVKLRAYKALALRPNPFFQEVYRRDYGTGKLLLAADHTGQLNYKDKQDREERFRAEWKTKDGRDDEAEIRRRSISSLFCSPTMELGIDIGGLSVVHMRNAPPNPANYAQRSGRAGRSGQPALVFTFCGSQSNHDRHYFNQQSDLVAGQVVPPRLDLLNEELLRSHLHAVFLTEIGLPGLKDSVPDLLDLNQATLPLREDVSAALNLSPAEVARVRSAFERAISDFRDKLTGQPTAWFSTGWIETELGCLHQRLNESIERWRGLYRSAQTQLNSASQRINSGLYPANSPDFKDSQLEQRLSQRQLDLLRNEVTSGEMSEFYVYRYLAAEGFLPGYNFTRLPLRVMLPGSDASVEFISRPRHIALREFGPNNVIYHKGQKFEITQLLGDPPGNRFENAVVSIKPGYFLRGDEGKRDRCPFSGEDLTTQANKEHLHYLLQLGETRATLRSRITCEEEERVTKGYEISTYFTLDDLTQLGPTGLVKASGEVLLRLRYLPTARLVWVNRKWRIAREDKNGFAIDVKTGAFVSDRRRAELTDKGEPTDHIRDVMFYTTNISDALYVEPVPALGLDEDGVMTLQFALKRAMERVFQVEPAELGVTAIAIEKAEKDAPFVAAREAWEKAVSIHPLGGDEKINGIEFIWNSHYDAHKEFVSEHRASKGEVMGRIEELANALIGYSVIARDVFAAFSRKEITESEMAGKFQLHSEEVRELYLSCSDVPFGPPDCNEVVDLCGLLGGSVDELFDAYSVRWMKERTAVQRRVRFETALSTLQRDLKKWEVAWEKVHHG